MRVLRRCRALLAAASLLAFALAFSFAINAQEPTPELSDSDIAWRTDFLKRRGYIASYSVAGSRVTAVVGPMMQFIPTEESRLEMCSWVLSAHQAENAAVTSARFLDSEGQVLLECNS